MTPQASKKRLFHLREMRKDWEIYWLSQPTGRRRSQAWHLWESTKWSHSIEIWKTGRWVGFEWWMKMNEGIRRTIPQDSVLVHFLTVLVLCSLNIPGFNAWKWLHQNGTLHRSLKRSPQWMRHDIDICIWQPGRRLWFLPAVQPQLFRIFKTWKIEMKWNQFEYCLSNASCLFLYVFLVPQLWLRQARPEGGLDMGKPRTEYYRLSPREALVWERKLW